MKFTVTPIRTRRIATGFICAALMALAPAAATAAETAEATMMSSDGEELGSVTLTQHAAGVLLETDLQGLEPGSHGFHIHETGSCEDGFKAAGGHFNPGGHKHGFVTKEQHAGDMTNLIVSEEGTVQDETLNSKVSLKDGPTSLFDADGSAIIVHEKADTYMEDAGAGGRVACGVIKKQ